MKMLIEVVNVPVSDVERAKEFYVEKIGFHLDGDWNIGDKRYVQLTPEGSGCSIAIGENITEAKPGSIDSILLVVEDIQKAHDELSEKGVNVTEVKKMDWGAWHIYFSDPDGNKWQIQQKPPVQTS